LGRAWRRDNDILTAMEPSLLSVVPPILAIGVALVFRHVVLALFLGIVSGALIIADGNLLTALLRTADTYIVPAIADVDHATIIVFSLILGGVVGVISASGGLHALVQVCARWATTARSAQLATFCMGIVIFFDDYANTLLVGNTMRPLTDRFAIAREKLAFVVDATAAPVAAITLSTWIGYEVGLIGDAIAGAGIAGSGMGIFIASLPVRFYPLLMILFTCAICVRERDFGTMYQAELRARTTGKLLADGATPAVDLTELSTPSDSVLARARWWNAILPIVTIIGVTITALLLTGRSAAMASGALHPTAMQILSEAASGKSLLWGALLGSIVAIGLAVSQRVLSLHDAMEGWIRGVKAMLLAMVILTLAWSIGAVTKDVHTAEYLVGLIGSGLSIEWLPLVTFLIAAATSFATGTSWGTMAILLPIVVPLFGASAALTGIDAATSPHFFATVSAVLAGAIFGDHCSPISDTTVLSSMASACDHIDHTKTQLPYALLVAGIAIVLGYIPLALGVPGWLTLAISALGIIAAVEFLGKPMPSKAEAQQKTA
jgi:Na+/H+ antiporter NhaC